jgi:hypothetical protein
MFKTKIEIAEHLHDAVLEKIVADELNMILVKQIDEKAAHGSKEKLNAIARLNQIKSSIEANENMLLYIKRKITSYKQDGEKREV